MNWILIALLLRVAPLAFALEERHEHSGKPHTEETDDHADAEERRVSSDVGPGKAVTAADSKRGIQLSEKALKALGIKTRKASGAIPKEALVISRENAGVYRLREGWFQLLPKEQLRAGDEFVVEGAELLRVAELAAFEGSGGHSH